MIIGIGTDMADIRRVERALERHGERFEMRCFTEAERATANRRAEKGRETRAGTFAKRWAAKEACGKALGASLLRGTVRWRDISVVNLRSGQPTLTLTGRAAARLAALTPEGKTARVHVSLTDEPPYASAFVVVEAI